MFLEKLELLNFKNYKQAEAMFCPHINCFTGLNGTGKTNILDAIYYLSITKSAFNVQDGQNIHHGLPFFSILGQVNLNNKHHKVQCSLKKGEKKTFKVDGSEYDKLSHHLGRFPVVLIAPNDDDLIRESSELRRKYFDSIISQTNREYLQQLIAYNHYLKQRNTLLKKFSEIGSVNEDLLEPYNRQIIDLSFSLSEERKKFLTAFSPVFVDHYNFVSQEKEIVSIEYNSTAVDADFEIKFRQSISKDLVLQRTTTGIHRDDYVFRIRDRPLKKFGSQGQQKSYVISLKLAQFDYIKANTGVTPFLLLDDIFDKLDDDRIRMLIEIVSSDKFQQIFLTDARPERTRTLLSPLGNRVKIFRIEEDQIIEDSMVTPN